MLEKLKKRLGEQDAIVCILGLLWIALFCFTFSKDSLTDNIIRSAGIFLVFVVPPYLYYFSTGKEDKKSLFFYCCFYVGVLVTLSYYLGIIGLNIKYHLLIPAAVAVYSLIMAQRRHGKK